MVDHLIENDQLVDHLRGALRDGQSGLEYVPKMLKLVLEEGAWCERFDRIRREQVKFTTFDEFTRARPTSGLGIEPNLIDRIVGTKDPDLLRLLKRARRVGQGKRTDRGALPVDSTGSQYGAERSDYTADRLARDAPDQYEAVRRGKTLNAAAIAAGIRPRRISIRTDDPASAARTIRRQFDREALAALIAALHSDG